MRKKRMKVRKAKKHKKIVVYKSKRRGFAKCHICKTKLQGVLQKLPIVQSKASKTEKVPTALFAGVLCNKCREKALLKALLVKVGLKSFSEEDILFRQYVATLVEKWQK